MNRAESLAAPIQSKGLSRDRSSFVQRYGLRDWGLSLQEK